MHRNLQFLININISEKKEKKIMRNLLVLFTLGGLSTCWPGSQGSSARGISHKASTGCCEKNGGKYCGRFISTCCKGECVSSWGMQTCSQNQEGVKQEGDDSCKTALSYCKDANGIPCAVSVSTSKITCCPRDDCSTPNSGASIGGRIMQKVVDMALSKVTMGVLGSGGLFSVSDILGGDSAEEKTDKPQKKQKKTNTKPPAPKNAHGLTRQSMQHDLALLDSLAQKLIGPNGKCKASKIIKIPEDAASDDMSDIVQARIGLFEG